jgi:transcriptional regulator with XRE-family HTH domain
MGARKKAEELLEKPEIRVGSKRTKSLKIDEDSIDKARKQTKLGKKLQELRTKNNLSLRDAHHLTGISHSYIRNIENGFDPRSGRPIYPSPDTLKKFAQAYGASYDELLKLAGYASIEQIKKDDEEEVKKERNRLFRERFIELKNSYGLTLQEISNEARVSVEYLTKLEKGKEIPTIETIYNLAATFEVTPDYLAGYTDDPKAVHPDTPKLASLTEFLEQHAVMYAGLPLTQEDKERVLQALQLIFLDAMQRNRKEARSRIPNNQ